MCCPLSLLRKSLLHLRLHCRKMLQMVTTNVWAVPIRDYYIGPNSPAITLKISKTCCIAAYSTLNYLWVFLISSTHLAHPMPTIHTLTLESQIDIDRIRPGINAWSRTNVPCKLQHPHTHFWYCYFCRELFVRWNTPVCACNQTCVQGNEWSLSSHTKLADWCPLQCWHQYKC